MNDEAIHFDVPDDAKYGDHDITEIYFHVDMQNLTVIFEDETLRDGWDQLLFDAENANGTIVVNDIPVGLVPPSEVDKREGPGVNESEALYDLLESLGIVI